MTVSDAGGKFRINKVKYDPGSANWFGVASSAGVGIWAYKTWNEVAQYADAGECTDLAFGGMGKEVWAVGGREVRVWSQA